MLDSTSSLILYVPFNMDFNVPSQVREKLTEEEFFGKQRRNPQEKKTRCFVNANFSDEISRLQKSQGVNIDESCDGDPYNPDNNDFPLILKNDVRNEIKRLKECSNSLNNFKQWIDDNGNGVYRIKGDAGTGKTTYLHYLEYIHREGNILWEIVDLENAHSPIRFLSSEILIDNFETLMSKVIASLLSNISLHLFLDNKDPVAIANNLEDIFLKYVAYDINENFHPDEVKCFFDESCLFNKFARDMSKDDLNQYASSISETITQILRDNDPQGALNKIWNVYSILLLSEDVNKKHIIAFDNIERFIRNDEIYNSEIQEFLKYLRHMLDSRAHLDSDYYKKFQMMVLMRNTSSRMCTPVHRSDFEGHELDLSGWFPTDKIVTHKLHWYEENFGPGIGKEIKEGNFIEDLIGKSSFDGYGPYSLQGKLGMLFNHNNRVTVHMLVKAIDLATSTNPQTLKFINNFKDNKYHISSDLSRFATRSIVMRLILDVLKEDRLFEHFIVSKKKTKTGKNDILTNLPKIQEAKTIAKKSGDKLGYSRKILSILHEYSLNDQGYMPFDDFLQVLFGEGKQHVEWYFDDNNENLRMDIAQILFYMNYYNVREKNWLHFIDIQCNDFEGKNSIRAKKASTLKDMIDKKHDIISMRIMRAGSAYLRYIVHSFEYFACRISDQYIPPLLCLIPNLDELRKKPIRDLKCMRAINRVKQEAFECIELMQNRIDAGAIDIQFKWNSNSRPRRHKNRIIYTHSGYINNFADCIIEVYNHNRTVTDEDLDKIDQLTQAIHQVVLEYLEYLHQ